MLVTIGNISFCKAFSVMVRFMKDSPINPLPHMPILGSSNSVENKDMMSNGQIGMQLSD